MKGQKRTRYVTSTGGDVMEAAKSAKVKRMRGDEAGDGSSFPALLVKIDVCVAKKRAVVTVRNFGAAPYFTDKAGVIVPNGYLVEKFRDGILWYGQTKVENDTAWYKFSSKDIPSLVSEWKETPTEAYKEVAMKIKKRDTKWIKGVNGRIVIGVHSDNVQKLLKANRVEELPTTSSGTVLEISESQCSWKACSSLAESRDSCSIDPLQDMCFDFHKSAPCFDFCETNTRDDSWAVCQRNGDNSLFSVKQEPVEHSTESALDRMEVEFVNGLSPDGLEENAFNVFDFNALFDNDARFDTMTWHGLL